ncbi:MAG: cyclase family protein [Bacteroidetes bacterium]|nr:cyclase family protein [Bacteroidota bacterium]
MSKCTIIDATLPIYNKMWKYRDGWDNEVSVLMSTRNNEPSTVYRFNLCSHTGTYIETSQHKLNNSILLSDFALTDFYRKTLVVKIEGKQHANSKITKQDVLIELSKKNIDSKLYDSLIIACGWGVNRNNENYIKDSPYFTKDLTDWIIEQNFMLLATDTPMIDDFYDKYFPVEKMFAANEKLLVVAPLLLNLNEIETGEYLFSCLPLRIKDTSAAHCRAVLIK